MIRLHIVAVTPDLASVVVEQTAAGWRLPSVDHVSRAGVAAAIRTTLERISATAQVVHWAPIAPDMEGVGGGGDEPRALGYCLAVVSGPLQAREVTCASVDSLSSGTAAVPRQRDALRIALARARTPAESFDSGPQVTAALDWAANEIVTRLAARITAVTTHRCARNYYIVAFTTTHGTFFLKAGRGVVEDEARLCELFRTVAPDQVPDGLSVDRQGDRWLYHAIPGEPLVGPRLTPARVDAVVQALVRLQKQAMNVPGVREHLASRTVRACDVLAMAGQLVTEVFRSPSSRDAELLDTWADAGGEMRQACARIDALGLPLTLALSDFWTENIIVTERGFGFIDLENAYWSYPFLPLWRFGLDVERRLPAEHGIRALIDDTFTNAWADLIPPRDMRRALADFPVLGRLFDLLMAECDVNRYQRVLGADLPTGYRAARLRPRLTALIVALATGRSATPSATSL